MAAMLMMRHDVAARQRCFTRRYASAATITRCLMSARRERSAAADAVPCARQRAHDALRY